MIKDWLSEPLSRGIDLNDPAMAGARKAILQKKRFLRAIYGEWYKLLSASIPQEPGIVLELGSGSGFACEYIPNLLSSEIFFLSDVSLVLDGCALPFPAQSLKAIIMTDVLHHIPQVRTFFSEATRCLISGGVVAMVEPWGGRWAKFVYQHFHHEKFDPESLAWEFDTSGPISGANGALPWIIFERDKQIFSREFPFLTVENIYPMMPISYLLSGGLSMRGMLPEFSYPWCRSIEGLLDRWKASLSMFVFIVLHRA